MLNKIARQSEITFDFPLNGSDYYVTLILSLIEAPEQEICKICQDPSFGTNKVRTAQLYAIGDYSIKEIIKIGSSHPIQLNDEDGIKVIKHLDCRLLHGKSIVMICENCLPSLWLLLKEK
ncbi:MAG: hypothetical protein HGA36_04255 [Candidatus Moranbacteria bacterium]|nr:hypothetical protein [Candidatus Moranbacteria bacterium]